MLVAIIGAFVFFQFREHRLPPDGRYEALQMLKELGECTPANYRNMSNSGRFYFFTSGGDRIGVDFTKKVVVMLSSRSKESGMWRCSGYPIGAVPQECSSLQEEQPVTPENFCPPVEKGR